MDEKDDDPALERKKAADKKTAQRKSKKALARVRRTVQKKQELKGDASLSEWEDEFVDSLEERLEEFGSAFADPQKGAPTEALSYLQLAKLKEVEKKAAGKAKKPWQRGGGFGSKKPKPMSRGKGFGHDRSYGRDEVQSDNGPEEQDEAQDSDRAPLPTKLPMPKSRPPRPKGPPRLTVISGGKPADEAD